MVAQSIDGRSPGFGTIGACKDTCCRLGSLGVFLGLGVGTEIIAAVGLLIMFRRRGRMLFEDLFFRTVLGACGHANLAHP
jgi:hypothetical protein